MAIAQQVIPLNISIAPFPEGFQGDMDETFQQACILMEAFIQGNFLTGLILPPGSTLPTTDQGPIAMGGQWYFWDSSSNQYLPQTVSVKASRNAAKNAIYQVCQPYTAPPGTFTLASGITKIYDCALARTTAANVLAIAPDTGPAASGDTDFIPTSIKYTVPSGGTLVPTLAATDLFAHEHVFEGSDLAPLQGETLSLSFSVNGNTPGTYSAYLTSAGRDMSYVVNFTLAAANTWYRIKIPAIPAFPTGTGTWNFSDGHTGLYFGVAMGVGTQWRTANTASWQPAFLAGTSSNINMLTVINNQLKITGLKLEANPSVSYLSVNPFSVDYEEVIRYYWTSFNYQSVTAGMPVLGTSQTNGNFLLSLTFPRRMALVPTVTPYGYTSHAAGNITDINSATDIAMATLGAVQKGVAAAGAAAGTTKGDSIGCFVIADARLT
jgi:hypothetical protein